MAITGVRLPKILGVATRAQARRLLAVTAILLVILTGTSLLFNIQETDRQYRIAASVVGRTAYLAVTTVRDWSFQVGGVYVPASGAIQPNPWLVDPLRDLETRQGVTLTKVNHAQMIRLYSDLLARERGIRVNITSPRPLRDDNGPDEWESAALKSLAMGGQEEYAVVGSGEKARFRFLAPLRAEKACLACHREQGFVEGEVIGGISVSFSYLPFQKLIDRRKGQIVFYHSLFFVFAIFFLFLIGTHLADTLGALQDSLDRIKRLEGMLPICAKCKNIRMEGRDAFDAASWVAVEKYIRDRTDADFTHGLCPQCARELYPDIKLGPRPGGEGPQPDRTGP